MDAALFVTLALAVSLGLTIWWLIVLIEALRIPSTTWQAAGQSQLLYILLMVFLGLIGTLVYIFVARPQLRAR